MLMQELPDCCLEATKTWKMRQLLSDLQQKYKLLNNNKGIGELEIKYLCLLLCGDEPKEISEKLNYSVETIRVKLSASNGLYKCIEKLTGGQIRNWRDPIILFLNKGYRHATEVKGDSLLIMTCDVDVDEKILRQLEDKVKEILGANKLKIQKIEKGSLVIYWQGVRLDCERIDALFKEGVLSERLGVSVLDIEIIPSKNQINLSQWFENIVTSGWQTVTELLNPQQLQVTTRSQRIERGKLIDLRVDLLSHAVVLLVNLNRDSDESSSVDINLRVYPTGDEVYLPASLRLLILSDNEVFQEVIARSADTFIQCQFEGNVGEEFTVQLVLGEAVVSENFVI